LPHTIGTLEQGDVVKVVGQIEPLRAPLNSPVFGHPCVYHRMVVEDPDRGSPSLRHRLLGRFHSIIDREVSQDFLLRDETGVAIVRAPKHDVFVRGYESSNNGTGHLRYREGILQPGQRVAALGRVVLGPLPKQLAERFPEIERCAYIEPTTSGELLVSNSIPAPAPA